MSAARNIAILGAGPVGALMGLFLARRGHAVTIYEQRPDMRRVGISAGRSINLALANRGIDALERAGLMDEVRRELIPMRGRMIHLASGGEQLQLYGNKPHEVIHSAARGALNRILMSAAERSGASIRFGHRCEAVDLAQSRLVLTSPNGGENIEAGYDAVVGADGSGSVLRAAIVRAGDGEVAEERLGHGYKELTIRAGPDGAFAMDANALHIWPRGGFMLIALPNVDGSFTATLFLPNVGPDGFAALRNADAVRAFFDRNFADAVPLLHDLTGTFRRNPTGTLGTIRCRPWRYRGSAVILGDAAHAIVPFHGQGLNAGFEDCVALDRALAEAGEDWDAAFAAFEAERKPNAEAIADMALENYVEMRDSVRDPAFLLKRALAWKLEELHPDRFVPRYSMVMFHLLPYAEARARGKIQAEILDELTRGVESLDSVDYARAEELIRDRLTG